MASVPYGIVLVRVRKDLGAAAVRSGDLEDWKMGNVETEKSRTGVGVTDRAAEDRKIGGTSSGLRIARTVGTTEVAVTAQQGAVTLVAQSDRRAAATTRMEEEAEGTTEVAATAQQGAETPVSHSDGQAAAETVVEEGSEDWQMGNAGVEAAAAAAGGAAEVWTGSSGGGNGWNGSGGAAAKTSEQGEASGTIRSFGYRVCRRNFGRRRRPRPSARRRSQPRARQSYPAWCLQSRGDLPKIVDHSLLCGTRVVVKAT